MHTWMSYIFFNSGGGSKNQALLRFPEIKVMIVFIPVSGLRNLTQLLEMFRFISDE